MNAWILLLPLILLACSKRDKVEGVQPNPKAKSVESWRDELVDFSKEVGGMGEEDVSNPAPAPDSLPAAPTGRSRAKARKRLAERVATRPLAADLDLPAVHPTSDSFSPRPFTAEEIAVFIRDRYRRAQGLVKAQDPAALPLIEEGQAYTKDGSFPLLKAELALLSGHPEQALVQAEQALQRVFVLNPEGPKRASLLICQALEAIKAKRPSEEVLERASSAWLQYNLTFSP